MVTDAKKGIQWQHASNLGCILANIFSKRLNIPAYIMGEGEVIAYLKIFLKTLAINLLYATILLR
ncbi:MAG: hypothetical protein KKF54_00740 [Candidatus Omnitrophica bacterium]|nr:hypothetical protein [Candidatus Omnitrophota bacterium]